MKKIMDVIMNIIGLLLAIYFPPFRPIWIVLTGLNIILSVMIRITDARIWKQREELAVMHAIDALQKDWN